MEGNSDIRQRLIDEGMRALSEEGVEKLSLRRVAHACGVSCAAPYRHFKDRTDFILAVIDAANQEWFERQAQALRALGDDVGERLRTVCKEYLRFLRDHPNFCSIITQRDDSTGKWHINRLFDQSALTQKLIREYAAQYGLTHEDVYRRAYVIRALLYGAAMMNQFDDMRLNESVMNSLDAAIDAQFVH